MSPSQIIVLATPVFLVLIAVEWLRGRQLGQQHCSGAGRRYPLNDTLNSISLGMLSQISAVFTRLLRVGIYTALYDHWRLVPDSASAFWNSGPGWVLALLFYDLCYYWLHRLSHTCALLWAAHVVHHQSQHYNLSTALRQTSSGSLLGWVFYVPMALAGVPPLVFGVVALVDLLYQFWVHTELIGKLGWFDRWFCSPSNHRVHHAVNDGYVDKNYGGILVVWDRLFGTFKAEDPSLPCVYGTRSPLGSWDPLWANLEVYWALAQDSWRTRRLGDKLRTWLKPPGWRAPDLACSHPKPPFDITHLQRFDPAVTPAVQRFAATQFVVLLAGVAALLWHADSWPLPVSAVWFSGLTLGLWVVGALLQGRIGVTEALLIESALLATVSAALGARELHLVFKPMTLLIAIYLVANYSHGICRNTVFGRCFLLALVASLAGDCLLMFPGGFIPGLVAFLIAHLAYTACWRQDTRWFAKPWALVVLGLYAAGMLAYLWLNGLPAGLHLPVTAYVVVITVMAAQAMARVDRAHAGQGRAIAATGTVLFVVSDSLLALNKFVAPIPLLGIDPAFWVLSSYYAAQILIIRGGLRSMSATGTQ